MQQDSLWAQSNQRRGYQRTMCFRLRMYKQHVPYINLSFLSIKVIKFICLTPLLLC